ncbi:MAG: DNA repair exonuclease [Lachnospiraceae bacterium]|nr:DNA repair exonuclease [Lachnospiraceae bacterium]
MKFIHIADVHLGAKPDRGRVWSDQRAEEIEQSFKYILKICEEQQVDLLLIAGDLFHEPPSVSRLKNVDYLLSRMPYTKTVIIAGNHDYIEEGMSWQNYQFNSNTVLFPKDRPANIYFEDINVCVTGYSYGRREYTERILERLKPGREGAYNILLGHGGDATHMPFSKEKLAKLGFDYIALGHIHKPAHILKNKMAFAGSLEPIDYTETGRHGYIMGELNGEGVTKISFVPFAKRSYINMALEVAQDYSNAEIMDIVKEQIEAHGTQNIYRIMLKGIIDNDLEINLSSLTRQYNINEIIDNTEYSYDVEELLAGNKNNLLGRFIRALRDEESTEDVETREKALKYGLEALLGLGEK